MQNGRQPPAGLEDEIASHLERLEQATGKRFGDPRNPLLVSVRSGAAVSMPGMMDTILNLGLDDDAVEGLARATANERLAYDAYRRLIQMYGKVVDGIDANAFEEALTALKEERGAREADAHRDDLLDRVLRVAEQHPRHVAALRHRDGRPGNRCASAGVQRT